MKAEFGTFPMWTTLGCENAPALNGMDPLPVSGAAPHRSGGGLDAEIKKVFARGVCWCRTWTTTKNVQSIGGGLVLLSDLSRWCMGSSHTIVEAQESADAECGVGAGACAWRAAAALPENPKRFLAVLAFRCSSADILCTAESVFCSLEGFPRFPSSPSASMLCVTGTCYFGVGVAPAQRPLGLLCGLIRGDRRPHRLTHETANNISGRH